VTAEEEEEEEEEETLLFLNFNSFLWRHTRDYFHETLQQFCALFYEEQTSEGRRNTGFEHADGQNNELHFRCLIHQHFQPTTCRKFEHILSGKNKARHYWATIY